MEIQIEPHGQYIHATVISPRFDASVLQSLIRALSSDSAAPEGTEGNIILDLKPCLSIDGEVIAGLIALHRKQYEMGYSFVITQSGKQVLSRIRGEDSDEILHLAPSFQEALDIVHMEILERDLLSED